MNVEYFGGAFDGFGIGAFKWNWIADFIIYMVNVPVVCQVFSEIKNRWKI